MSNVMKSGKIIVIDDDESHTETEIDRSKNNATLAKPDLRQPMDMETEAEQSNSHKSDPLNPDSSSDFRESLSQRLTHTITAILGSIHGMSSGDVNKLMESEKVVITELHDSIKTVSKLFENFSISEKQKDFTNTSRSVETPCEVLSVNKEISENISINNEILMNLQRIKRDFIDPQSNKKLQKIVQRGSNEVIPGNSRDITLETLSPETRLQKNHVPNQKDSYVNKMKDKQQSTSTTQSSGILSLQKNNVQVQRNSFVGQMKDKQESTSTIQSSGILSLQKNNVQDQKNSYVDKIMDKQEFTSMIQSSGAETSLRVNNVPNQESIYAMKDDQESISTIRSSGIKIGDNWELPIIVLDSDDDGENEIIEIDSEEEEIQEFREMMSLEDVDCIEIGKDEFEVVVKSKKVECENTENTDDETDDEPFIPIMPGVTKKRRRSIKSDRVRKARRRAAIPQNSLNLSLFDDDPLKWRKDLPAFPIISNPILRTWATGFLSYRKEWERLEYLGDKVLMFCVLRFATTKYLQYYSASDIKVVTTFLVSNKLLAAYSLTLGLDKQNQMQGLGITKKVADAFEAYIGAYYLSDGEAATTRYLDQLMSPLFQLVLTSIQTGRDAHKIMNVMANYFNMGFLVRLPKLSK